MRLQHNTTEYSLIHSLIHSFITIPAMSVLNEADDFYCTLETDGGRQIGYSLARAELEQQHRTRAIVYFYPLSGCSRHLAKQLAPSVKNLKSSMVVVDRPDCGSTSPLSEKASNTSVNSSDDFAMHRIRGHVTDVLHVLAKEQIKEVFVLSVCIGHPYAVELARQLLHSKQSTARKIELKALTLVAPFVSTACPHAWRIARLGASVPSFLLYGFTEAAPVLESLFLPYVLTPSTLRRIMSEQEQDTFGWTEEAMKETCQDAIGMLKQTKNARGVEARLGVSSSWQREVCDAFAVESGCGLVLDKDDRHGKPEVLIRIHACLEDKLVSPDAVEWIANRCYGGCEIIVEDSIHSHELMTFFGGPRPLLLEKIVRAWDLWE